MSLAAFILTSGLLGGAPAAVPGLNAPPPTADSVATALFAGGSFWCLEPVFEKLVGVDSARAGYAGPSGAPPTFDLVTSGASGYVEAVQVFYHPKRIRYAALLDAYWRNIDPTRADGQFSDAGPAYRTIVYYQGPKEKQAAELSRKKLDRSKRFSKPVATEILPAETFFPAEAEHQDYYRKAAVRYRAYYKFSGREDFLKKAWGRPPVVPR